VDPITREEIIAEMLKTYTQSLNSDNLEDMGMTAEEINERTQIGRNNISKYLNIFVREGRAVKIKSRPVRFFDRKALEEVLGSRIPDSLLEVKSPEELRDLREIDAFSKLIGYDSSLKKQIKMAKSAVLYPPDGLHSLLIGPTGSGKNALAEAIYNFGVQSGRFAPTPPSSFLIAQTTATIPSYC
jgi:transcriptional regulator with AAA-type ATPase domain